MNPTTYLLAGWLMAGGLGLGSAHAQAGLRAAGGLASGTGGTASYSVGQLATAIASGPGGTASPGAQQPLEVQVLSTAPQVAGSLELSAYPNPTAAALELRVAGQPGRRLSWRLTDLSGRQLLTEPLAESRTAISLAGYEAGTYLLTVFQDGAAIKTFKISKY